MDKFPKGALRLTDIEALPHGGVKGKLRLLNKAKINCGPFGAVNCSEQHG